MSRGNSGKHNFVARVKWTGKDHGKVIGTMDDAMEGERMDRAEVG